MSLWGDMAERFNHCDHIIVVQKARINLYGGRLDLKSVGVANVFVVQNDVDAAAYNPVYAVESAKLRDWYKNRDINCTINNISN